VLEAERLWRCGDRYQSPGTAASGFTRTLGRGADG
jgi:hypothetical protein